MTLTPRDAAIALDPSTPLSDADLKALEFKLMEVLAHDAELSSGARKLCQLVFRLRAAEDVAALKQEARGDDDAIIKICKGLAGAIVVLDTIPLPQDLSKAAYQAIVDRISEAKSALGVARTLTTLRAAPDERTIPELPEGIYATIIAPCRPNDLYYCALWALGTDGFYNKLEASGYGNSYRAAVLAAVAKITPPAIDGSGK